MSVPRVDMFRVDTSSFFFFFVQKLESHASANENSSVRFDERSRYVATTIEGIEGAHSFKTTRWGKSPSTSTFTDQ